MRQIEEVNADLAAAEVAVIAVSEQLRNLKTSVLGLKLEAFKIDAAFVVGDVIENGAGESLVVIGYETDWKVRYRVRKQKKDGQPSRVAHGSLWRPQQWKKVGTVDLSNWTE